jgi:hypothetical protein
VIIFSLNLYFYSLPIFIGYADLCHVSEFSTKI